MEGNWRHEMLAALDKYCAATGRARTGVGKLILNDVKFFSHIANGGNCTVDTYVKVMDWLKVNTPDQQELSAPPGAAVNTT